MGTEPRPRRRLHTVGGGLLALGVLLTGCASMPDDGKVERVHRAEPDSQVRVFGVSPQNGESPQQIVRGFLEATTSDEASFTTAKQYLTRNAAHHWKPFARTTVLSDGPTPGPASRDLGPVGGAARGYTVEVNGARMADVDGGGAYTPAKGVYKAVLHLTREKGEWRIDDLPQGLVLGASDFQRIYRSINNYYYARLGADGESVTGGRDVLVADPVYLRRRIDPVTETVTALLSGPSHWLAPVATSAFPAGTRLAPHQHLSLDDSGALTVRLDAHGAHAQGDQCARMAAQLLHTVQDQASAKVNRVELDGPGGARLCDQTREQAADYEPGRLNGRTTKQYFIDGSHRVAAFAGNGGPPAPLASAMGRGEVEMGAIAVNRAEREGAAVTRGRRTLYVTRLVGAGELGAPVLVSKAKHEKDGLTAPTWDGLGDLWIADRDPAHPRLLRLTGGRDTPEEIPVPELRGDERIEGVRIASDGVRIALQIRQPNGRQTLELGRVERKGTLGRPDVSVRGLRAIAPQFEDVTAMSWAGGSRLVVVGKEPGSVQQLLYLETDGSAFDQPTLPGINDVTGVAASEDESKPLLAETDDGIVRLPPDANWRTVTDRGTAPVYPG